MCLLKVSRFTTLGYSLVPYSVSQPRVWVSGIIFPFIQILKVQIYFIVPIFLCVYYYLCVTPSFLMSRCLYNNLLCRSLCSYYVGQFSF